MELDKPDDLTDPNTGEIIVEEDAATTVTHVTLPTPIEVETIPTRRKTAGKVGRPITSPRTLAATFPEIPIILAKLEAGECFTRTRTSHASSEVWSLFDEIAYTENSEFTGIVRCKMCHFMTRYHGQITGTSHMRRHPCFANSHSSDSGILAGLRGSGGGVDGDVGGGLGKNDSSFTILPDGTKLKTYSKKYFKPGISQSPLSSSSSSSPSPSASSLPLVKRGINNFTTTTIGSGGDDCSFISWSLVYEKFTEVKDALTSESVGYLSCKECKALIKRDIRNITGHTCKSKDIARKNSSNIETSLLLFRQKPKSRATPVWEIFEEIIDPTTNIVLGYVRCKQCKNIIRATDPKSVPAVLRKHIPNCPADPANDQSGIILPNDNEAEIDSAIVQIVSYNTNSLTSGSIKQNASSSQSSNQQSPTRTITSSPRSPMGPPSSSSILNKSIAPSSTSSSSTPSSSKIVNAKTDFREKVIQFCYSELVGLEAVTSESFKRLAQSLVSLGSQYGRSTLVLPDVNQLQLHMNQHFLQVKETIRIQLDHEIARNMGGSLVCDTQGTLCILSAYYINRDWQLVESILSATVSNEDINSFITTALNDYGLNEEERLAKFTFVSRGGLFDGVNICLPSIAHTIDQLIETTIFNDEMISELVENCRIICAELKAEIKLDPITINVTWIYKWELMNTVLLNRDNFEMQNSTLDIDLIKNIVDLLIIFKEASVELRQCNKYPTLNHVLLWYHKLLKVLNATSLFNVSTNHVTINVTQLSSPSPSSSTISTVTTTTTTTAAASSPTPSTTTTKIPPTNTTNTSPTSPSSSSSLVVTALIPAIGIATTTSTTNDPIEETPFLGSIKNFLKLGLEQHFSLHHLHKIATFLWPNFRYLKMLTTEEREEVHSQVRSYIDTRLSTDEGIAASAKKARSDFSDWEDNAVDSVDEVEKYITAMLTSCNETNLLQWWKEHQNDFPKLSHLAKWVLSIPASVTSLEKFKLHPTQRVNDELLFLYCNSYVQKEINTLSRFRR
ncbi:uncharacterized protein LOC128387589 isoform X2 [Panonychus citri]|uniref:uncharacterized protein LOC128387589 isoform X2 n=1 Tax=Panonychus citri TaxID=50023 RepID=UPI002307A654|nr:uncharacterized protein LOC128387589 isoform X2 [Panonychus citri]